MLRRRDAGTGKIRFVDINDPLYSPEANAGLSYEQACNNFSQQAVLDRFAGAVGAGSFPVPRTLPA